MHISTKLLGLYGNCSDQALQLWIWSAPVRVTSKLICLTEVDLLYLLGNQLVSHNFIPGVPYGSNRRKKEILLEQLQLKGIGVVSLPDISHKSLTKAKHLHVWCQCRSTDTSVVAHQLDTNGESNWLRKTLGSAAYRWEIAPTGLHHKLTGECHSRTFVRACADRVRSYHG